MTIQEKLDKLEVKIKELKWSGIIQIFYNSGGKVGIKPLKEDKEINE